MLGFHSAAGAESWKSEICSHDDESSNQKVQVCHLDCVVCVGDDGDEEAEDHVYEERHKGVEVDSAEDPHQVVLLLHVLESGKHVVSVDQGEETLRHRVQAPELQRMSPLSLLADPQETWKYQCFL